LKFFNYTSRKKPETDDVLLERYTASGNLKDLGELYERYMTLVYGLCLKYLKDEESAKDAVMQIFEELVSKLKIHEVKAFRSWLFVLSRNFCLMQLRSGKNVVKIPVEEIMELEEDLHPENEKDITALEKCIQTLNAMQKESIDLFYLKEKCYKEIAVLTGYTINEVKSYIQNGKRNLKICLEKNREE